MPPPRHGSRPERIGVILKERLDALGWQARLREEEVLTGWEGVVGPQISAHARPSHIAGRLLIVITESPVWTQQLSLLRPELLRRIGERFGPQAVTDLFFVTGKIDPAVPTPRTETARLPAALPLPEALERELDAIPDAGVRECVRQLMLAAQADENPAGPGTPP